MKIRTYEVTTRDDVVVASTEKSALGGKCHEVFFGRSVRCERCPIARDDVERTSVLGANADGSYLVALGRRKSTDRAEVTITSITPDLVRELLEAHISDAATKANLSRREREVLELLMAGRTIGEIATALSITSRTAKYHQSNVLTKLGAESRLDLLRLLL